ncbi:hypothetical protein O2W14_11655 [Modestobacter sp. VKM Ac-2986]|uniref:hypothetical protein n=1 Tax=Modestobacter sp. VKM Ac-2986 TaxID=3004140 RepID=UPI0022AB79FD|nr:hypothetical protein [Modestobacter sp. VKM Ac-2986]MCZ2829491.1 hypothetical protein [Modestobacter sp. VKM Ac-2986]
MTPRWGPAAAAALLLLAGPVLAGCSASGAEPPAASGTSSAALPTDGAGLEPLLLDEVPSGRPRVPDDELQPPAGEKTIDDVARYGDDAQHQEDVLGQYGYQRGWERFWRSGDELTSVFLDQFTDAGGASSYAVDLAGNDAEYYGGTLDDDPTGLPEDCTLLLRTTPAPELGMAGPAAFTWCPAGPFTVSVASVAADVQAARAEVLAVTRSQLDRLPPS